MFNKTNFKKRLFKLKNIPRIKRIFLLIIFDAIFILFSFLLSCWFIYDITFIPNDNLGFIFFAIIIGLYFFINTGQYQSISRYSGSITMYKIGLRNFILFFLITLSNIFLNISTFKSSLIILTGIISTFQMITFRFLLRDFLLRNNRISDINPIRVAIYGAGSAGAQLAASIAVENFYEVITFIDDDPKLHRRLLYGIPINSALILKDKNLKIDQVLFAIPSISYSKRRIIINNLQAMNMKVSQVPSIDELTTGKTKINNLKPINIDDLLGRDIALPNDLLLNQKIQGAEVCITGAGGTIGSELCKQVLKLSPKKLIIIENSENNLYKIDYEIKRSSKIEIISVLGNTNDEKLIKNIFENNKIDIIFHAAAYKHVPLVEANPVEGIFNNVFSTLNLCKFSSKYNIKNFILISSDKAVRPSNVMGASKRLAELIVQAFSKESKSTIFSMVRFGNVLGSSGSVVPLFKKQIKDGGPITITHKDILRYFMTVTEASQLVIQTSAMAKGGDVFLLKMGEPVKIIELAKQMIHLSGLSLKSDANPNGDIEIVQTGLRPGEKLYEELLIDADAQDTDHPLIFRAIEDSLDYKYLIYELSKLEETLLNKDIKKSLFMLQKLVPTWKDSRFVS